MTVSGPGHLSWSGQSWVPPTPVSADFPQHHSWISEPLTFWSSSRLSPPFCSRCILIALGPAVKTSNLRVPRPPSQDDAGPMFQLVIPPLFLRENLLESLTNGEQRGFPSSPNAPFLQVTSTFKRHPFPHISTPPCYTCEVSRFYLRQTVTASVLNCQHRQDSSLENSYNTCHPSSQTFFLMSN